jgi:hypothetical protein
MTNPEKIGGLEEWLLESPVAGENADRMILVLYFVGAAYSDSFRLVVGDIHGLCDGD